MTPQPASAPIVVGQIRADWYGYTIEIISALPDGRFSCRYEDYSGEDVWLSPATIHQLYPTVVEQ